QTREAELDARVAAFRSHAREFANMPDDGSKAENLRLAVSFSVLADLIGQGWIVEADRHQITVEAASFDPAEGELVDHAKRRIRKGLQIASNRQLAEPSVQQFLRSM